MIWRPKSKDKMFCIKNAAVSIQHIANNIHLAANELKDWKLEHILWLIYDMRLVLNHLEEFAKEKLATQQELTNQEKK